jgi:hypothetical protein
MSDIFGGDREKTDNAAELLATVEVTQLVDAIVAAVRAGWLISFGCGQDGYAASVAVLDGGKIQRVWCENADSLEKALDRVLRAANEASGTGKSGSGASALRGRRAKT